MSPPTAADCVPKSGLNWPRGWETHNQKGEEAQKRSKADHDSRDDVWDELEEVDRLRKEKNAEEVLDYMESRLSQLTRVDSEEEETSTQQHDLFSKHHKEVVKKGADKNG